MPLRAIARLIQTMLYARRFFPYYVYNILGGIEDDGTYSLGQITVILFLIYSDLVPFLLSQDLAQFIPSIPWARTSASPVVLQVLPSPLFNRSWTIR